ncbi:signal transduction histidine kinase [Nocardiopsis sp. Huas11]|uniref:sensor histidine kinase n=1 Tax=Nocardiopsis sp. Huas11 TaxID=2183912 RepID=UPI000EAD1805|nr:histidine kinase [Nocardiopsis sp. Huas11]RKS08818.1 signal transduction histidine kinase [Nocardiopsis sp. Huas11]
MREAAGVREHTPTALLPAARGARALVGHVLGGLTTAVTPVWACACALVLLAALPWPRARRRTRALARRWTVALSDLDAARRSRWYDSTVIPGPDPAPRAAHLLARWPLGAAGLLLLLVDAMLTALFLGGTAVEAVFGTASDVPVTLPGVHMSTTTMALGLFFGAVLLGLLWALSAGLAAAECALARRLLGPTSEDLLHRRIDELTRTRSGIVRAVDEERRRIERDLHDGVQQRVVALAMLLGRAQRGRDPERAADLVRQAHAESRLLVDELREVAWRVYPAALDTLGLRAALTEAADRTPLRTSVRYELAQEPPQETATAVYFAAREAITNAVKHAEAAEVFVDVRRTAAGVELVVHDDGRGGADPDGGGLTGLARRVRALDGALSLDSPEGGPTTVRVFLPVPTTT